MFEFNWLLHLRGKVPHEHICMRCKRIQSKCVVSVNDDFFRSILPLNLLVKKKSIQKSIRWVALNYFQSIFVMDFDIFGLIPAQTPHPHKVRMNRCVAPRRARVCVHEWKNIPSVKYYELWLRDLNAIALGSIVRCKYVDNDPTTITIANIHTKKQILMAKANIRINVVVNQCGKKRDRLAYSDEWEGHTSQHYYPTYFIEVGWAMATLESSKVMLQTLEIEKNIQRRNRMKQPWKWGTKNIWFSTTTLTSSSFHAFRNLEFLWKL